MKNDAIDSLGTILEADHGRDAVHIAVISAISSRRLFPGQNVGPEPDGSWSDGSGNIGIVDPFLGRPKLKLRLHDWELGGFRSIAERYGGDALEVSSARSFHRDFGDAVLEATAVVTPADPSDKIFA